MKTEKLSLLLSAALLVSTVTMTRECIEVRVREKEIADLNTSNLAIQENYKKQEKELEETKLKLEVDDKILSEMDIQYNPTTAEYLGEYACTAYCCEEYQHVCGTGDGITASGAKVTAGVTVAAPKDIPFGTVLYIEGVGIRIVQDRGSAVNGNNLDIAVGTHEEALNWAGYGYHEVWILETPEAE